MKHEHTHDHSEHEHHHHEKKQSLSTPGAIVVAGFLVAAAIFATHFFNGGAGAAPTTASGLRPISARVGLNNTKFLACVDSGKYKDRVESEYQEGQKAGVQGTPWAIIVGKNGAYQTVEGAYPATDVQKKIDLVLAGNSMSKEPLPIPALRATDYTLGDKNAEVMIYEYSDTECPFCKRFHDTMHQVMDANKGKVAWTYRIFPLDSIHPKSRKEAQALLCAGELAGNTGFWKYLDTIFEITPSNNGLDPELL